MDLVCELSPENLSCDGELSQDQVKTRRKVLMQAWRDIEATIGMMVTEEMVWAWANELKPKEST
jgi:hypothetical protein